MKEVNHYYIIRINTDYYVAKKEIDTEDELDDEGCFEYYSEATNNELIYVPPKNGDIVNSITFEITPLSEDVTLEEALLMVNNIRNNSHLSVDEVRELFLKPKKVKKLIKGM